MAKYRKKPVVVDATRWYTNGDHPLDNCEKSLDKDGDTSLNEGAIVRRFRTPDGDGPVDCQKCGDAFHLHGWIDTLEGGHIVCPGDWIITGVQGEHYPCKPDIFAATYEEVA